MSVASTETVFLVGLDGIRTQVEVDVRRGIPSFKIVGLPTSVVEEARERVIAAIKNTGIELGARKIVINLSPAEVPKRGSHAELPIAVALLKAMGVISHDFRDMLILGELALDGKVRSSSSMFALLSQSVFLGFKYFIIPRDAQRFVDIFNDIHYLAIEHLSEIIDGEFSWQSSKGKINRQDNMEVKDFADVKGQYLAKYGAMLAVAGMHNMVMIGSPGVGKTMIAERILGIYPPMTEREIIEVTKIYSATLGYNELVNRRPFRQPHSNVSASAMFGGGRYLQPGEVTLAHRGVLFIDEFPEFRRDVLEGLRTVLESRKVFISKADVKVNFPADFLLVMASNPCPCGYLGHSHKQCRCSTSDIRRYQRKFSGPLMERMDIQLWMTSPDLNQGEDELTTDFMREKVMIAREIQEKRYNGFIYNGTAPDEIFLSKSNLTREAEDALIEIRHMEKNSGRELSKIMRIARTLADISASDRVTDDHIWTAFSFRRAMDVMVRFW